MPGPPATASNLELAGFQARTGSGIVVLMVDEGQQGGLDLNNDGDVGDDVLHVFDSTTKTTTNLGFAVRDVRVDGDLVAFGVLESQQGTADLNNDGDAIDYVLYVFVFDPATTLTTTPGLAVWDDFVVRDGYVAFRVDEAGQGATDLNGDGDAADPVLHLFDRATLGTTNLGVSAAAKPVLSSGVLACLVGEDSDADLNGDGDMSDHVLHLFDPVTGVTTNTELAGRVLFGLTGYSDMSASDSLLAFVVDEARQGHMDLNGDGDVADGVLFVHHFATGHTQNAGVAANPLGYAVGEDFVALPVFEIYQGSVDMNGDGDVLDPVLHVYDSSLTTTSLGLAARQFSVEDELVLFSVIEGEQGDTDLNGDGDGWDRVQHVFDVATSTVTNVGLSTTLPVRVGDHLVLEVLESEQGSRDLNGDGDALDAVLHVFDTRSGIRRNLGTEGNLISAHEERASFVLAEDGVDLNLDGDETDLVLHELDPRTGGDQEPAARRRRLLARRDPARHRRQPAPVPRGRDRPGGGGLERRRRHLRLRGARAPVPLRSCSP